jgi:mRNA interferase MazF
MKPQHGYLYLADLNPGQGTEPGKIRPVLVIQSDLLNKAGHPSTWVVPCTTNLCGSNLLRVVIPAKIAGNTENCELMIDQSRSIDNRRLKKKLKSLPELLLKEAKKKLRLLGEL